MTDELVLHCGESHLMRVDIPGVSGYLWIIGEHGAEVIVVAESAASGPSESPPGDAGTQSFRITAHTPGRTQVNFNLERPWQPGEASDKLVVPVRVLP